MRVRCALFVLVLFLWATPAFSQGCAMCRSSAAATSKEGQRAISKGVLVLVLPPAGFMTLGLALAFRYGKKRDKENF
jgi:Na+-translocating ferredoxin:NAD+ oxidoreductase RnfE subunit